MRVLMLTRDPRYADADSDTAYRLSAYRKRVDVLDVVLVGPFVPWRIFQYLFRSYDLVTSPDPFETGVVAYLLSFWYRASLELQVHTDISSPFYRKESAKNYFRYYLALLLLPRATCVRVVSSRVVRSFPSLRTSLIPIFPHYERTSEAKPRINLHEKYPQFGFICLALSRLAPEKNIPLILKSFARVARDVPSMGLVIVGSGKEEHNLKVLVHELGIENSVVFEPHTTQPQDYFRTADLFLSASDYEGYGLTFVESALALCPILSTDVGCLGDTLPYDSVAVVPPRDGQQFEERLRELVASPELRAKHADLAKNALSSVGTFEDFADRIVVAWKTCHLNS